MPLFLNYDAVDIHTVKIAFIILNKSVLAVLLDNTCITSRLTKSLSDLFKRHLF